MRTPITLLSALLVDAIPFAPACAAVARVLFGIEVGVQILEMKLRAEGQTLAAGGG